MLVHVIWISAPRWLYTVVYIIFGVSGVGFLGLFWQSPSAGPAVVWLIVAGGICYIAGAVVYALRWPNPWPRVFGFHEIFHCGTVAGYACHVVAIFLVVCNIR
jgi:hemolysin III